MLKKLFILLLLSTTALCVHAQQTKEEITKRQQELQKELADLNNTLTEIKKNKKQSLGQLALVQRKIRAREELVNNINKDLRRIDEDIYHNNLEIYRHKKELDTLKLQYAKSLVFAYKNRSNYDYLNFIFSANTFNDALKRVTYLKSYRQFRETQVDNILKTEELLQKELGNLTSSKNEKSSTLKEQGKQLAVLETDKKEKDQVVQELKGREKDLAAEIKNKEKARQQLQKNLQVVIRREIEEEKRKEKERQLALAKQQEEERKRKIAEQQKQAAAGKPSTAENEPTTKNVKPKANEPATNTVTAPRPERSYSALESTEEGLTQSINFEISQHRLLWPVSTGFVSVHFGSYEIPGTHLKGVSDGIDISLPVGTSVKAVADGSVVSILDLGDASAVIVRHGKYFTTYSHLASVNINKGDPVKAGTLLGKAAQGDDGDGVITFMVMNDRNINLDPERWLKPR